MPYTANLKFAGKEEAEGILRAWEREDGYLAAVYKQHSKGAEDPLDFLNSTALRGVIPKADGPNARARSYPYMASTECAASTRVVKTVVPLRDEPIDIVYLDPRSDTGLPHTRGKKGIAMPIFLSWNPSEKTMAHELVHVSQKQFSDRWWLWYKRRWNFRVADREEFEQVPERIRDRRRINPDLLGSQFVVWRDRYVPLSLFTSSDFPDLRNAKRGFWDLKMKQWTWEAPPGWVATFGSGFNDEHPHEIAAHWIDGSAGEEKRKYFDLHSI